MKKTVFTLLSMFCLLQATAYANSSWHWVSQTRPYDVLPIAVVITLLIEILGIIRFVQTNKRKSIVVILLGNILSFATPYILALNSWYGFENTLQNTPFYNISVGYLLMTLIVEFPIVYNFLKKECKTKKYLITAILVTNVITTAITCLLERLLCHGVW